MHVFVSDSGKKVTPIELRDEYAVMIVNDGDAQQPRPAFLLGSRREPIVHGYGTFQELLGALERLPRGTQIAVYDRDTLPTFYDVDEKLYPQLQSFCSRHGLILGERKGFFVVDP